MNRRLFWKIFLPFWVSQAILLGALYLRVHDPYHSEHPWWTQPERREMPLLASLAARATKNKAKWGCRNCLTAWLSRTARNSGWWTPAVASCLDIRSPTACCAKAHAALQSGTVSIPLSKPTFWLSRTSTSRGQYLLVAEFVPPPLIGARSRRYSLDAETRYHLLRHSLPGDRALTHQAH